MHNVAVAVAPGVVPGDLATPCEVFGRARDLEGAPLYALQVCAHPRVVDAGLFQVVAPHGLDVIADADIVVIPGVHDVASSPPADLLEAIRSAARAGARVVSICTGAFVLAATGLLDGRRATTHWAAAAELARRFPAIEVDPAVLYVDDDPVWTSAGAAAGLDLCLQVVRRDHGAVLAAQAARMAVMPLERSGGQAQFIVHELPESDGSLQPLLQWVHQHLDEDLSVAALARQAAMSPRTLARRFRAQTGQTPGQWVHLARVRRAQELLETTDLSMERIAEAVGFGSSATLRERFRRIVGAAPLGYRRAFSR